MQWTWCWSGQIGIGGQVDTEDKTSRLDVEAKIDNTAALTLTLVATTKRAVGTACAEATHKPPTCTPTSSPSTPHSGDCLQSPIRPEPIEPASVSALHVRESRLLLLLLIPLLGTSRLLLCACHARDKSAVQASWH